ncbi:hypothetical protein NQ318_022249 [Aromia moschata]|uniref:Uncharacterized protein n=1 Tax=Aromia moschata TaxID=1265417 RepID=A0AAV8XG94_9CUCU|nr:hypothetical protein NQ318_022249 [Aromia moschata]
MLFVLGKVDIRQQLDSAYRENIRRHNENVDKNRHILNQVYDEDPLKTYHAAERIHLQEPMKKSIEYGIL